MIHPDQIEDVVSLLEKLAIGKAHKFIANYLRANIDEIKALAAEVKDDDSNESTT